MKYVVYISLRKTTIIDSTFGVHKVSLGEALFGLYLR